MAQVTKVFAAQDQSVEIDVPTDQTAMPTLQLDANYAGSVVLEASILPGVYVVLGLTPVAGGAVVAAAAGGVPSGMWNGPWGSYDKVRARQSTVGAGGKVGLSVSEY